VFWEFGELGLFDVRIRNDAPNRATDGSKRDKNMKALSVATISILSSNSFNTRVVLFDHWNRSRSNLLVASSQ
jgi:predicted xylose isomerase-like sugar epimerase